MVGKLRPIRVMEDKNMKNENKNEEAVSPVIATILMVAITVVLAGVLYVWASQLAEGNTDGDFSMYDFKVEAIAGNTFDTGSGEEIVRVALDKGEDLSWSTVIVQMKTKTDGDATSTPYVECTNPDKAPSTGCAISDNDDGKWAFGEEVTISEGSDDVCSSGTCEIQIRILDRSTNKLIYESNIINA